MVGEKIETADSHTRRQIIYVGSMMCYLISTFPDYQLRVRFKRITGRAQGINSLLYQHNTSDWKWWCTTLFVKFNKEKLFSIYCDFLTGELPEVSQKPVSQQ